MEVAVFFAVDFEEDGDVVGEPEWGGSVLELELAEGDVGCRLAQAENRTLRSVVQ